MSDCQYPPYVRNTLKVTPYWRNYKIGDRSYNVNSDGYFVCIKPCVRLEGKFEEVTEPDSGKSPPELGYDPKNYWSDENWEREKKVANG